MKGREKSVAERATQGTKRTAHVEKKKNDSGRRCDSLRN